MLLAAVEVAILIQQFIRGKLACIYADKMRKAILIQWFIGGKLVRIHADKMRKEAKLRKEGGIEGSHHESWTCEIFDSKSKKIMLNITYPDHYQCFLA